MSLVNDMLRDLDQRRKESDGPSGAARLVPAADYPSDSRKFLLPIVLLGLILTSGGIWYYWNQLNQSGNEQRLDIQLQPVLAEAVPATGLNIQQPTEVSAAAIVQAPPVESQSSRVELQPRSSAVENQPEPVELQSSSVVESQPDPVEPQATTVVLIADEPEAPVTAQQLNVGTAQQLPVIDEVVEPISESVASSPSELNAGVSGGRDVEIAEIVNLNPLENEISESVKEAPEYTSEQRDTIAVQEAVQLISDGQMSEAHAILGRHIESNRYASQSREFYAQLLLSQGKIRAAYELVESGLELSPNHQGFKKVKARLLIGDGQMEDAVSILITRAPDIADDTEYHDILATVQLLTKDYEGAALSYRGLVQQDQSQGKWWYGFAAAQDRLGNVNDARQAYRQAIQYSNLSASLRRRSQERLDVLNP